MTLIFKVELPTMYVSRALISPEVVGASMVYEPCKPSVTLRHTHVFNAIYS